MNDHYAEAERLLDEMDYRNARENLAAAQVHATLATVQRNQAVPLVTTDDRRTIPWPPSEELVERVVDRIQTVVALDDDEAYNAYRAVLDAIAGDR